MFVAKQILWFVLFGELCLQEANEIMPGQWQFFQITDFVVVWGRGGG